MRTTVVLEDRLFRRAKRRAAEQGVTLSQLVSEALRAALDRPPAAAPRFEVITFGAGAPRVRHEPGEFAAALEEDDRAAVRR